MNRRDALGRFVARAPEHARAWYQGWRAAATVGVGVGVGVKDVHYKSPHHNRQHHHTSTVIHHHNKMGRSRSRTSKRGRSRSKSRSKGRRRRPKGTIRKLGRGKKSKGATLATVGRNWPPTMLRATMESRAQITILKQFANDKQGTALQLTSAFDNGTSGIFMDDTSGTGTHTQLAALKPRNWDELIPHYRRARYHSTKFKITYQLDYAGENDISADWTFCVWYSSDLDNTNPIVALDGNLGGASPWGGSGPFCLIVRIKTDMNLQTAQGKRSAIS